ncbi:unnamed protein product [Calypogeia fissa]
MGGEQFVGGGVGWVGFRVAGSNESRQNGTGEQRTSQNMREILRGGGQACIVNAQNDAGNDAPGLPATASEQRNDPGFIPWDNLRSRPSSLYHADRLLKSSLIGA